MLLPQPRVLLRLVVQLALYAVQVLRRHPPQILRQHNILLNSYDLHVLAWCAMPTLGCTDWSATAAADMSRSPTAARCRS